MKVIAARLALLVCLLMPITTGLLTAGVVLGLGCFFQSHNSVVDLDGQCSAGPARASPRRIAEYCL